MKKKTFDDLYRDAESHEDYWIAGAIQEFTEMIFLTMERKGISRSELARRLGTSPAYVTKILRGNANFTLATMVKLARALGADLRVGLEPPSSQQAADRKRSAAGSGDGGRGSSPEGLAAAGRLP